MLIRWFNQIANGIVDLGKASVCHSDLCAKNIIINQEGDVKITDFGNAGMIGEEVALGTMTHMDPESLDGKIATKKTDVWWLGMTMLEGTTSPYDLYYSLPMPGGKSIKSFIRAIKKKYYRRRPAWLIKIRSDPKNASPLYQFILDHLVVPESERLEAKEIVKWSRKELAASE
jgi:serine/threonine protein kinase